MNTNGHEASYASEMDKVRLEQVITAAGQIAVGNHAQVIGSDEFGLHRVEPRAYQLEAWQSLREGRAAGHKTALIHLATGLGKTTVGAIDALQFAGEQIDRTGFVPRILFACHQTEILEQASARFASFAPMLSQGWYGDKKKELDATITFATMQSLYQNLQIIEPERFNYIIYD